jgi:hypothetical protein
VVIEARKAEVDEAGQWRCAELARGVVGGGDARRDRIKQASQLLRIHLSDTNPPVGFPAVLPLHRPLLDEITLGASAAAVLALVSGFIANVRVGRLRRTMKVLEGTDGPESVLDALGRGVDETRALRSELGRAKGDLDVARRELADALRHVAVVRYDAFGDMGGRMSFTAALLDDSGDGLVITSINGRTEARAYAKGVKEGQSDQSLSPEEIQAIGLAMGRKVRT